MHSHIKVQRLLEDSLLRQSFELRKRRPHGHNRMAASPPRQSYE